MKAFLRRNSKILRICFIPTTLLCGAFAPAYPVQAQSPPSLEQEFPSAFLRAVALDYPWIIEKMLKDDPSLANAKDGSRTQLIPLFVAITYGRIKIMEILLRSGAAIEGRNAQELTPLMYSGLVGRSDALRLLVEKGANVSARTTQGLTPTMFAALNAGSASVKLLLEHGGSVETTTATGATVLMLAGDEPDVIDLLVERGAAVNSVDKNGRTALFYAITNMHFSKLETLMKNGADPTEADHEGLTAIQLASRCPNIDARKKMLDILGKRNNDR
jgi:ankyrin repeat protein